MNKATTHRYTLAAIALLAVIVGIVYYYFCGTLAQHRDPVYLH